MHPDQKVTSAARGRRRSRRNWSCRAACLDKPPRSISRIVGTLHTLPQHNICTPCTRRPTTGLAAILFGRGTLPADRCLRSACARYTTPDCAAYRSLDYFCERVWTLLFSRRQVPRQTLLLVAVGPAILIVAHLEVHRQQYVSITLLRGQAAAASGSFPEGRRRTADYGRTSDVALAASRCHLHGYDSRVRIRRFDGTACHGRETSATIQTDGRGWGSRAENFPLASISTTIKPRYRFAPRETTINWRCAAGAIMFVISRRHGTAQTIAPRTEPCREAELRLSAITPRVRLPSGCAWRRLQRLVHGTLAAVRNWGLEL